MATRKEAREVSGFDRVLLRGQGELYLQQGETESLEIEADESLLERLTSEVHGHTLELGRRRWWEWILPPYGPITYYLSVRDLSALEINGDGRLFAGPLHSERLELDTSGSARMQIERLEADTLRIRTSGAARIEISAGQLQRLELHVSGSGELHAAEVHTGEAEVTISGSGEANLDVEQRLDVRISGAATVRYHGQPRVSQRISGAGRIEQVG